MTAKPVHSQDTKEKTDLVIIVEDTGIGIKQTDQNKIFDSFEQQSNQDFVFLCDIYKKIIK